MDELDRALARAWEIFIEDLSDETDRELGELLPQLTEAGYVATSGESTSGHFWRFTPEGVERAESLGLSD
jgi:hypothetical protein